MLGFSYGWFPKTKFLATNFDSFFFFGDIVYNSIATNRILLQPNSIFNLNYQPTIISISKVKFVHNTIQWKYYWYDTIVNLA